jgi:NADH-quinone oxidoreductase subunit A
MQNISVPSDYFPIVLQILAALGFVVMTMVMTHLIGPKRRTADKLENFECGIEQQGDARSPISVKYFLVAILFVLFDVEVIFMYPWAVNFREFGFQGFIEMFVFIGLLLAGLFYVVKKGALDWE